MIVLEKICRLYVNGYLSRDELLPTYLQTPIVNPSSTDGFFLEVNYTREVFLKLRSTLSMMQAGRKRRQAR